MSSLAGVQTTAALIPVVPQVAMQMIAHELRQPLSAIQNFAAYLKARLARGDRGILKKVEMLEQQAEMAGEILSNLMCFACSGKAQRSAI